MTEAAIRVEQLSVRYRGPFAGTEVAALDRVDLVAAPGEIVALLGPNGSGKSTLLRVLAGVQDPHGGSARVLGLAPTARQLSLRAGWQPDESPPLQHLRAREVAEWLGTFRGLAKSVARERSAHWLERMGLGAVAERRVRTFSSGMQRRLALCLTFMTEPDVLLLDEPTATLDPEGSWLVLEVLTAHAARGGSVLLASHHLQEVEQICHRAYVLRQGRVVAHGTLDELLGTGEQRLVVSGLDAKGHAAVAETIARQGAELVRTERTREHLFALFRRLGSGG